MTPISQAAPREEAVRRQVRSFKEAVAQLLPSRSQDTKRSKSDVEAVLVAKLFEEVKILVKDVPLISATVSSLASEIRGRQTSTDLPKELTPIDASTLRMIVDNKPFEIRFAASWQRVLHAHGWPSNPDSRAREILSSLSSWVESNPASLLTAGPARMGQTRFDVVPQAYGIEVRNFGGNVARKAAKKAPAKKAAKRAI